MRYYLRGIVEVAVRRRGKDAVARVVESALRLYDYDEAENRRLRGELMRAASLTTLRSVSGTRVSIRAAGASGDCVLTCAVHNDVSWVQYVRRFSDVGYAVEAAVEAAAAFERWRRFGRYPRAGRSLDHFVVEGFSASAVDLERELEPLMTAFFG